MKRARKGRTAPRCPLADEAIASADKPYEPPIACATMAPPDASPETAAKFAAAADGIDGWFNGYYAVRNLGRSLVTEATVRMDRDPDRAVAMATAYVALLAADGRARA